MRGGLLPAQLEVVVGHRERPRVVGARCRAAGGGCSYSPTNAVTTSSASSSTGSAEWVIVKPSWQTSTGSSTSGCSASRGASTHQVVGLLRVLGEELDHAGVADQHRVGVVAVDVDRPGERAVADRHHDRRAHRRGDVDDLRHQREPLRRGRGHRARAGERRADRRAHRRVLGLDVDELAVRASVRDELGEALDDRRLRGDRVDRHDVRDRSGASRARPPRRRSAARGRAVLTASLLGHHRDRVDRAHLGADLAALAVRRVEARRTSSRRVRTAESGQ